jgi:hypothetical protein
MEWLIALLPGAACGAMCAGCVWMMVKGHRRQGRSEGEDSGPVLDPERKDG